MFDFVQPTELKVFKRLKNYTTVLDCTTGPGVIRRLRYRIEMKSTYISVKIDCARQYGGIIEVDS